MKVLHTVEFYYPSKGGAQEVVRQVSEQLAKRGHQVTVATTKLPDRKSASLNGVRIEEFATSRNVAHIYQEFLRAGDFDVMMNYAAQQWATDRAFPVLDQLRYRKIMAPCGFSALNNPRYESYFRDLPDVLRKYDHLIFHSGSGRDIEFARKHGIENYSVIPNGASFVEFEKQDLSFRQKYKIPADEKLLLTVGSHTGAKGHSVAMEAFRRARIGPATLVIIGNTLGSVGCLPRCYVQARFVEMTTFGKKRVLLLNPPRDEVVSAYHSANLFVFGSSIECSPIVLFEAAASRTPFLSSACGNAAEIAEWTGCGKILSANTVAAMAKGIEDMLSNKRQLRTMAESGFENWEKRFTWQSIAAQYEQIYEQILAAA